MKARRSIRHHVFMYYILWKGKFVCVLFSTLRKWSCINYAESHASLFTPVTRYVTQTNRRSVPAPG